MTTQRILFVAFSGLLTLSAALGADQAVPLAPYQPPVNLTSTLRLGGNRHMAKLAQAWADAYRGQHPEVSFEIALLGNGTAMPALYLGLADVVFFGRDPIVTDRDGFAHVMKYDPLGLDVATGSLATPGNSPALVLLVHRDNPLTHLTLTQVDAIFSSQRRRSATEAIRTWGQLGLTGEWANQPIHLYGDDTQSMTGLFFQRVALGDSRRMNWEHYTEFQDIRKPDGSVVEAAQQSAAAIATDRWGLAISNLHYQTPALKALALSKSDGTAPVEASAETLVSRAYPLARPILAFVNQAPGRPLDPKVQDFLLFLLGPAGQRIVAEQGDYLPLSTEAAKAQRTQLKSPLTP